MMVDFAIYLFARRTKTLKSMEAINVLKDLFSPFLFQKEMFLTVEQLLKAKVLKNLH